MIPTKGCSECHLLPTDLTVRETAERANINITELMDFKTAAVDAIINHVIKLTGNDDALHADYGDKGGHRLRHDDAERAQQLLHDLR